MSAFRIVVTDDRYGDYTEENRILEPLGCEVEVHTFTSDSEAVEVLKHADAVLLNLFSLSASVIHEMKKCRIVSRYGVGYDNVDVEAATALGIWVARVPDYCIEDASDHAVSLLLACVRQIALRDRSIRMDHAWNIRRPCGVHRTSGKVLGILGFGAVGKRVQSKLSGFPFSRVLVHDPFIDQRSIEAVGAVAVDFETLLRESDYLTIHVPLTKDTRHRIGEREFGLMKPDAILVNTSRGAVLDEAALCKALQEGRICAAGLDVFEVEPLPKESPLLKLESVVLSDHAAWYSEESITELKRKAAMNVLEVLKGNAPLWPVNNI